MQRSHLIKLFKIINALVGVLGLLVGSWGIWQWYQTKDFNEELQKKLNNSEKRELNFQKELSIARDNVVELKYQLDQAEMKIQHNIVEKSQEHQAESREEFENTSFQIIELKKTINDAKNDLEKKDRILNETRQAQNWTLSDLNKKERILNEIKQIHERTLADLDKKNSILRDTNKKIVGISTMLNEVNELVKDNPSCEFISTQIIGINREIQNGIANFPQLPNIPTLQPPGALLPPQNVRVH